MKFISINGSSCAGKSTVVKNVLKQRDHLFHLSYDSVKWLFSKYSPKEESMVKDLHRMMLSMAETAFEMKYDVISETGLHREWRETIFAAARAHGYEVVEVTLECEYEILAQRFDERVADALAHPEKRISNTSKDRFREIFDIFQKNKNVEALTFRTDTQSLEEISESILKLF